MHNYGPPDGFNDDTQIYFIDQLAKMLDGQQPLNITDDHVQAIIYEAHMTDTLTIHQKLSAIQIAFKAPKNHFNDYQKFAYRNAEDILDEVKPLAHKLDCVVTCTTRVEQKGDRFYMISVAKLTDSSGSICSESPAREPASQKGMSDGQLSGSTKSYADKYALKGLFAIGEGKDLDSLDNTTSSTAETDPEIVKILQMIEHEDIDAILASWNSIIAKHWNDLSAESTHALNKIIDTKKD